MKKLIIKTLLLFGVISSAFLFRGCSSSDNPPLPTNGLIVIKATIINGKDTLIYEAPGTLQQVSSPTALAISTAATINNTYYSLLIYIYYVDSQIKLGTFDFTNAPNQPNDYGVGLYQKGSGSASISYISVSGKVSLDSLTDNTGSGVFNFNAKIQSSSDTTTLIVKDGVFKFPNL